jgi:hypothetical protein
MLSRGQIKLIHLAKDRLNLPYEEYKEVLELYGGVSSSKDLDAEGFFSVMEFFREMGFQGRGGHVFDPPSAPVKEPGKLLEMVTPGQRALIGHLEKDLGWSENPLRLENFLAKRFGIKKIRTKSQAMKVIEALKAILARHGHEEEEAG